MTDFIYEYEVIIQMNDKKKTDKQLKSFIDENIVDVEIVSIQDGTITLSWLIDMTYSGAHDIEESLHYVLIDKDIGTYQYSRIS